MTRQIKKERRLYPRVSQQLPLHIATNGYDFTTTTQNVSCIGAYCYINKYIPPFTKIAVKMVLPMRNFGKNRNCEVECRGVVVRSEDAPKGGFNIALFFNQIKDSQQKKISQYISQFLPQKSSIPKRI